MKSFETTIEDVLRRGVAARFFATGDSMHPTIRNGEHLHVVPVDWSSLRVGDVVLARAKRGLTAHRLVALTAGTATTRGDNAVRRDAAVSKNEIIGRITHVERDGATIAIPGVRRLRRIRLSLSQIIRSLV